MCDCKHYDRENGWCKIGTDWSDPMPTLSYCDTKYKCAKYEREKNQPSEYKPIVSMQEIEPAKFEHCAELMSDICLELKFPYGQPDRNGVIYSKDAIKNAFDKGVSCIPIIYIDNDGNESIIGCTKNERVVTEWDDSNGICKVKVNGTVFFAGTSCIVNKVTYGVVEDFEITSIGISK